MWRKYGKTIAAALVLIVTAVQAALSDGHVTQVEGVQIAIAATNAGLIYLVPNTTRYPWVKLALSALLAVLQLLTTLIIDGVSSADVSALLLAAMLVASGAAPSQSGPSGASGDTRRDALAEL
ncbi:hypothetical protein ACFFX1_55080 [Dactylosporangium sucinum]|uniref:Holin n=1 Tax=Dactylosporangium sucinum TaxID=1424081 RepID=A0A917U3W0_9ACTN|nr:hypothetical protein [Dactylosporangium sucinum]GGM53114.1 hypothetical protein GCM10007977_063440 [Dactylosporangium sucinum]